MEKLLKAKKKMYIKFAFIILVILQISLCLSLFLSVSLCLSRSLSLSLALSVCAGYGIYHPTSCRKSVLTQKPSAQIPKMANITLVTASLCYQFYFILIWLSLCKSSKQFRRSGYLTFLIVFFSYEEQCFSLYLFPCAREEAREGGCQKALNTASECRAMPLVFCLLWISLIKSGFNTTLFQRILIGFQLITLAGGKRMKVKVYSLVPSRELSRKRRQRG